jgi:hypothetical protein
MCIYFSFILIYVGILSTNCSINELQNIIEEDGIFALFRKGSFHSLTKVHANLRCHLMILKHLLISDPFSV